MKTVWKYVIPVNDKLITIPIPLNTKIVHVDANGAVDNVSFWAEVDEYWAAISNEMRSFQVFGTGHPIPADYEWIGSTTTSALLVWHLYEVK